MASHNSARRGIIVGILSCILALVLALAGCAQQPNGSGSSETAATAAEGQANQGTASSEQTDEGQADAQTANKKQEQATALAKERIAEAALAEPAVTRDLKTFESDTARLVSLEFRLKSEESLTRKILADAHTKEISLEQAAAEIGDVLRYTFRIEPDAYARESTDVLKGLEASGYEVTRFKNTWDSDLYKGLNTNLKTPDGLEFEIQFHTPDSFETKERTHPYYEIARSEDATEEEVEAALSENRRIVNELQVPEGATELSWD